MMSKTTNYSLMYHKIYIVEIVLLVLLMSAQTIVVLGFNLYYKKESCDITAAILSLENEDLTGQILKIQAFRNMIHCVSNTPEAQQASAKIE